MMNLSFQEQVERFVEIAISDFHERRAKNVQSLKLLPVLSAKNPYLFRANHLESAADLIRAILDARLSSAEEGMFGQFMEDLAKFVSQEKCDGKKSSTTGIDIDLEREGIRYLIAVKSGKSWSNSSSMKKLKDSSSMKKLKENFQTAVKVLRQNKTVGEIQPTIGICYGRTKRLNNGAFLQVSGQDFWELISGEPDLYMDIIEPIGYKAREFNDEFIMKRDHALNRMVREFTERFCTADGKIDWQSVVTHVSKTS